MANLNHLKIHNAPKAFTAFAERHNELVGLIESLEGALGIDIQIAHSPKQKVKMPPGVANPKARPRGKILVATVPTALDGFVGGGGAAAGGNARAVGPLGLLIDVLQPASPSNANSYPEYLKTQSATTNTRIAVMDGDLIQSSNAAKSAFISATDGFGVSNGSNVVGFRMVDITRDMFIKTMSICVNGNTKSILVLASDPF
jgi:hypothetical protein